MPTDAKQGTKRWAVYKMLKSCWDSGNLECTYLARLDLGFYKHESYPMYLKD